MSKRQHSSLLFDPIDRGLNVQLFVLVLATSTLIITPPTLTNAFSVDYCHATNCNKLGVKFKDTKRIIRSRKLKKESQYNLKRTINVLQNTTVRKLKIEQREPYKTKPRMNSCIPERHTVYAPLVASVLLL